jgi:hypothetical protein
MVSILLLWSGTHFKICRFHVHYIHGNNEHAFICKKENMKFGMKTKRFFRVLHIYHIYWILSFYGVIQKVNDESVSFVQI